MSRLSRDGTAYNPSRETKFSGANTDREMFIFPVQLTTCSIGNLTRSIHTLVVCVTIHILYTVGTKDCHPEWKESRLTLLLINSTCTHTGSSETLNTKHEIFKWNTKHETRNTKHSRSSRSGRITPTLRAIVSCEVLVSPIWPRPFCGNEHTAKRRDNHLINI